MHRYRRHTFHLAFFNDASLVLFMVRQSGQLSKEIAKRNVLDYNASAMCHQLKLENGGGVQGTRAATFAISTGRNAIKSVTSRRAKEN